MTKGWSFWLIVSLAVAGVAVGGFFASPKANSREMVGGTPELRTMEGSITDVDKTTPLPVLKLTHADGRLLEVSIDPMSTVVLQGRRATTLTQLEKGQKVKVSYQQKEGREVANAIEIMDPLPMPTAPKDGLPAAQGTTP